jgi:hypothetical protein
MALEVPLVRPGKVASPEPERRIVALFYNSAQGNSAIQLLTALGVPNDRLGVTVPDRMADGQGMILSIPCIDAKMADSVEKVCREQGAEVHRQRG